MKNVKPIGCCTLIDESEVLEAQAAEAIWEDLTKALPMLNIGLVHRAHETPRKTRCHDAF
ncbi:ATP-dependent DNA helicase [Haemophilus influenzae]|uniref:ATP-dependent DNA helicase n=1 Tax=Haemophilus influenzae TaxID=727 RepID=A0A2X1PJT7_HAEIF|nr:ATP-dependent DNA helicase [Haemophilus influenzae]